MSIGIYQCIHIERGSQNTFQLVGDAKLCLDCRREFSKWIKDGEAHLVQTYLKMKQGQERIRAAS